MDIKEIRRINLMRLIAEYESQQALADAVDVTPAVFSQIINKRRNIGEKMARKIEAKLGKPEYWFDHPQEENSRVRLEKARSVRVPVINWDQVEQVINSDYIAEPSEYIVLPLAETQAYCLIIEGDSMIGPPGSDAYPPGCYVVVNPDAEPANGSHVVAKNKITKEVVFRVYRNEGGSRWLRPLNPQYQAIPMTTDYVILGVAIGTWIPRKTE